MQSTGLRVASLPFQVVTPRHSAGKGVDEPFQPAPNPQRVAYVVRPPVNGAIAHKLAVTVMLPVMLRRDDEIELLGEPNDARLRRLVSQIVKAGAEEKTS